MTGSIDSQKSVSKEDLGSLQKQVDQAWADPELLKELSVVENIKSGIMLLDQGLISVASRSTSAVSANGSAEPAWQTHEWVKKLVLLYFRIQKVEPILSGDLQFLDKIPVKVFKAQDQVRVVPPAIVRIGAFVEAGAILMPSFVNIGARVGANTMVDTWATVGSCAQIGKNVHLSGGVGIGGVLEPLQAQPVIIEDGVFIGSRCVVVEGVRVREGAVLGAGVVLTQSTRIIDVHSGQELRGEVPPRSVVIPGSVPKKFPSGEYHVPCALIVGQRKQSTDEKTSLNQALRDFEISV